MAAPFSIRSRRLMATYPVFVFHLRYLISPFPWVNTPLGTSESTSRVCSPKSTTFKTFQCHVSSSNLLAFFNGLSHTFSVFFIDKI